MTSNSSLVGSKAKAKNPVFRCALRQSECRVCNEDYGAKVDGVKVMPVVLPCGHDLCERCGDKIKKRCPRCREVFLHPPSERLRVEFVKPAEDDSGSDDSEEQEPIAELTDTFSKMLTRCEKIGKKNSIDKLRTLAKSLEKTDVPALKGSDLKVVLEGMSKIVVKLCESLADKNEDEDSGVKEESRSRSGISSSQTIQGSNTPFRHPAEDDRPQWEPTQTSFPSRYLDALVRNEGTANHAAYGSPQGRLPPDMLSSQQTSNPPLYTRDGYAARKPTQMQQASRVPSSPQCLCAGRTAKGEPCRKVVSAGATYCYNHVSQSRALPPTTIVRTGNDGRCCGMTKRWEQCRKPASQGGYCHLHGPSSSSDQTWKGTRESFDEYYDLSPAPAVRQSSGSAGARSGGRCLGITKQGAQCKRNASSGGYCFQHG